MVAVWMHRLHYKEVLPGNRPEKSRRTQCAGIGVAYQPPKLFMHGIAVTPW
jgi:hypothetical protein